MRCSASPRPTETAPRQLRTLDAEIGRMVDAIAAVGISPALQQRLRTAETERERLASLIEQAQSAPRQVIDDITARYRRQMLELQRVLEEEPTGTALARCWPTCLARC